MSTTPPSTNSEYMFLFRGTAWHEGLSPQEIQKVMTQWYDWFDRLAQQGKVKGGQPLAYQGKMVSGKNGVQVTDGPFAESKEAIGGYFLLTNVDEAEAVEIAKQCPALVHGLTVEVRPLVPKCPSGEIAASLEAAAAA